MADEKAIDEEIVSVGSRGAPRSATDSPVPVDVFNAEDLGSLGNTADLTDNLKSLVPSYTATPAVGDGSAFVRPTSLRGLSSDQTLVLVNGKRRHRSSLIQINAPAAGEGSHSPDIAMIPSIALQRVEVLRDGAAAQYGSDAIAGVINFVPKSASEGGAINVQYGQYYDGEDSVNVALNKGFSLGENGFLNLSLEVVDNEALSRGIQHAGAQALIDGGAQGVGQDTPFGDAPLVQTFGRPQQEATRFFFNSGTDIDENTRFYLQGNYAKADGRYRFFWRDPGNSALDDLVADFGYSGALLETGFTPYLDG
ncbi:MAG: TonB-dependent receptor plug domain-containing protein, partial [Porticoccaceae bacterium]|nr:TonB-dependent receptor plug domain-containing protein [Porticoccaceae bacterium]